MSPTNFFDFRQRQKIIFPCPTVSCHLSITRTNSFNKARTHTQNHTHVNAWFLFYTRMHPLHLLHWISLTSPQAPPPSYLVTASPCLSRAHTHTYTHTHAHETILIVSFMVLWQNIPRSFFLFIMIHT